MLHELDDSIIALHDAWLAAAKGEEARLVLPGESLERYALKVLLGLTVSGAARVNGRKVKITPPQPIVDVVFGLSGLRSPRGFYFVVHDESDGGFKLKVNTPPKGHELEGVALGITIQFLGFRFLIWLNPAKPSHPDLIYRPAGFDLAALGRIDLQWNGGAHTPAIPIDIKLGNKEQ